MRAARDVDGRHALANVQERDGALIVYNSATLKEVTRPAGTAH